jgi:predicted transposase/invertase (TIGR01784 family)
LWIAPAPNKGEKLEKEIKLTPEEAKALITQPNGRYDLRNDLIFKHFFGNEDNNSALKELIENLYGFKIRTLKLKNTEQIGKMESQEDGYFKTLMDIIVETESGRLINLEMQRSRQEHFLARSLYYVANSYAKTYHRGSKHPSADLVSTIALNIVDFKQFPKDKEAFRTYELFDKVHNNSYVEENFFSISYLELKKLSDNPVLNAWISLFNEGVVEAFPSESFEENVMEKYNLMRMSASEEHDAAIAEKERADKIDEIDYHVKRAEEKSVIDVIENLK